MGKQIKIHWIPLFLLLILLFTQIQFTSAQEAFEEEKLQTWKDLVSEFTPAVSNPDFLVIKKNTFNEFIELIKSNEAQLSKKADSLIALAKAQLKENITANEEVKEVQAISSKEDYYNSYILFLTVNIIMVGLLCIVGYLLIRSKQQNTLQSESLQNIEADFLRYKRSTLEREKKMTREIIDLKKIVYPDND